VIFGDKTKVQKVEAGQLSLLFCKISTALFKENILSSTLCVLRLCREKSTQEKGKGKKVGNGEVTR
jgi:hypothetical protein